MSGRLVQELDVCTVQGRPSDAIYLVTNVDVRDFQRKDEDISVIQSFLNIFRIIIHFHHFPSIKKDHIETHGHEWVISQTSSNFPYIPIYTKTMPV